MGYSPFMQPLVRAAVFAALFAGIGMLGLTKERAPEAPARKEPAQPTPGAPVLAVSCGPYQLPEGDVCLPIPRAGQTEAPEALDHVPRALRERGEVIPRRPERPARASAYRFPLPKNVQPVVLAGLDLPPDTVPDVEVSPAAVLLGVSSGDEVVVLTLEGQEGPAEITFVGDYMGSTVVTSHMVRDGGRLRQMLLVHGYLQRVGEHVIQGSSVDEGDVLGYVGSLPTGNDVLYVEARQVREGANPNDPAQLLQESASILCDVRNVLPQGASL